MRSGVVARARRSEVGVSVSLVIVSEKPERQESSKDWSGRNHFWDCSMVGWSGASPNQKSSTRVARASVKVWELDWVDIVRGRIGRRWWWWWVRDRGGRKVRRRWGSEGLYSENMVCRVVVGGGERFLRGWSGEAF